MPAWELRTLSALGFDIVITPAVPSVLDLIVSYDDVVVAAKFRAKCNVALLGLVDLMYNLRYDCPIICSCVQ